MKCYDDCIIVKVALTTVEILHPLGKQHRIRSFPKIVIVYTKAMVVYSSTFNAIEACLYL